MFSLNWMRTNPNLANLNDTNLIAGFLQGEAGNQGVGGMQAVASVLQNRVSDNYNGYGDVTGQLLAPSQFQGWQTPGPGALSVAQQLQEGQIPDITGGATQYYNPAISSPSWGIPQSQGLTVGGHLFLTQDPSLQGQSLSPGTDYSTASGIDAAAPTGTSTSTLDNAFQSNLQQSFPNDPSLGGLYPSNTNFADSASDFSQDYTPQGQLRTDTFGNMSATPSPDVGPMAFAGNTSQFSGLDATAPSSQNFVSAMTPEQMAQMAPQSSDIAGGASLAPGPTDSGLPGPLGMVDASSGGQAQDFLGGAFSPQAVQGLDPQLQSILGGSAPNIQSPTSDFSGTAPQAQAKTPASTEGQIAEAKATEDEAKSIGKAADALSKAYGKLAGQQAKTGEQSSLTNAQDTKVQTTSAADIANTQLGTLKDLTQRTFIVLFGIIMLAGAVYYFSSSARPSPAHA